MLMPDSGIQCGAAAIVACIACAAVLASSAQAGARANGPAIQLTALPGTIHVSLTGPVAGSDAVSVSCARNETESFQVVVTARDGTLRGVDASLSVLTNRAGNTLPAESVELYCAVHVPVRMPDPRSAMPPGMWADALVPRTNPYTGEPVRGPKWGKAGFTGERFRGRDFDVWPDQNQPLWVDVRVPKDAAPGVYTGEFTVRAENAGSVRMPVEVEVWDFALPDGPTHENHFGGFSHAATYYGLAGDSEEFLRLEDRFIEMMAAHRINPPLPQRLAPPVGEDGTVRFDDDLDQRIAAFVARHSITNIQVPGPPFADVLGADRAKAMAFYRSWYAYLERKGWSERAYLYMLDEPNNAEAYERVRRLGALVADAAPNLRRLVVEQPYTENPDWGVLDGSADIWCPLFGYIDEENIRRVQQADDDVWTYTALVYSVPDYHPDYEAVKRGLPPYWEIDFPLLSYRIAPWLNRRYGATGLLYWATCFWGSSHQNPWDNPAYGDHWNGEGMLFYPGSEAGIDGPIASVRLKNLRDGMEDYEYFVLLEQRGGADVVEELVRNAVPTWGSWDNDTQRLLDRRRTLAHEILRRGE